MIKNFQIFVYKETSKINSFKGSACSENIQIS